MNYEEMEQCLKYAEDIRKLGEDFGQLRVRIFGFLYENSRFFPLLKSDYQDFEDFMIKYDMIFCKMYYAICEYADSINEYADSIKYLYEIIMKKCVSLSFHETHMEEKKCFEYVENIRKSKEYFLYLQSKIFQFLDFLLKDKQSCLFRDEINFQCKKHSEKCYELLYEMISLINKIDYILYKFR